MAESKGRPAARRLAGRNDPVRSDGPAKAGLTTLRIQTSRAVVKRGAKLAAPVVARLPDLGGLVPGATAIAMPEARFDATYYDTVDLRLARRGITLRHRDGEPGPPWTVKLPKGGKPALARREIQFNGPAERVPDKAADLVLAFTRHEVLEPVACLMVIRRPFRIRDHGGQLLADVVDDTVWVSKGRHPGDRFREVKVNLHVTGRNGRRILVAVVSRLAGAGCSAEAPIPRLVRALGDQAARPPDVVVSPLAPDASVIEVVRHAVARSVVQILHHDPGVRLGHDPEHVHQLRVGVRRLRSDLRSFAPLLEHDRLTTLRAELGWLGTVVGAVRDTDVLASMLSSRISTLPEADVPGGAGLLRHLASEADDARSAMLDALHSARYVELLDTLVDLAVGPPFMRAHGLTVRSPAQTASRIVSKPWHRLAHAVHALGPQPSDAELHRVRILAKRCRYATEAVAPIVGPRAVRFAAAVEDVQTVLGDHQDTVVAESWLRRASAAIPASGLAAGQLVAQERSQRIELRNQWPDAWHAASSKRLRRWL